MDFNKVQGLLEEWGEPRYRGSQVYRAATRQLEFDYRELTDLPLGLRSRLAEAEPLLELERRELQTSSDGTLKARFETRDGFPVEAVAMRHRNRRTVCVSSQSGCPLACTFCATGSMGLGRNLRAGEIAEQVLVMARLLRDQDEKVSNVVMMGMGEPFLNYDAVLAACRTINDPDGFGLGARQIAISTAGWIPGIDRLAEEQLQVKLALSLHAPTDQLRADADAGQPPLPAGRPDGRLPPVPREDQPPDLRRVPAAGRRQRLRPRGGAAREPARPRGVSCQPDRLQPDRRRLHGVAAGAGGRIRPGARRPRRQGQLPAIPRQ